MEETITLQQHFYGSAPVGLSPSRGFQTIAKSAGLDDVAVVEQHCSYSRPSGRRSGEMPVNWGWFPLDQGPGERRVCIHRIGYAGTDEFGRPGNFLAHNLVVAERELEIIDYDVPSVIRWVRYHSPSDLRYPQKDGSTDGFVRQNTQLYDRFGNEKSKLKAVEPLVVPVKQIRDIRRATDDHFLQQTLDPLIQAIRPDGMESLLKLLKTYLCDPAERKPIWLLGLSDGANESSLELTLAEFFFAILPCHCRRLLTFATYDDVRQSSPHAAPGRTSPSPHKNRRLVMMVPGDGSSTAVSGQAFVFDFISNKHDVAAQPAEVGRHYVDRVRRRDFASLKSIRDLGSHFQFPDEMELEGLEDCRRLSELVSGSAPLSPDGFALYHKLTGHVRPGPFREFLETGHRLIEQWPQVVPGSMPHLEQLVDDYMRVLPVQFPILAERAKRDLPRWREQILARLKDLFHWSLQGNGWDALRMLLSTVRGTEELAPLRKESLEQAAELVRTLFARPVPDRFARLWSVVYEPSSADQPQRADPAECRAFLTEVAAHLCRKILDGTRDPQHGRKMVAAIDDRVLPILSSAPLERPEHLADRLELVNQVCKRRDLDPDKARKLSEDFLVELVNHGYLQPGLLEEIAENRRDLILRFYQAWRVAVQRLGNLGPLIQRVLDDPGLVAVYWNTPPEQCDRLLHKGLSDVLAHLQEHAEASQVHSALVPLYQSEGCGKLCEHLARPVRGRSPGDLSLVSAVHCQLIAYLYGLAVPPGQPPAGPEFHDHLLGLVAALCLQPRAWQPPWTDGDTLRGLFRRPLKLVFEMCAEVPTRTRFFAALAGAIAVRCVSEGSWIDRNILLPPMFQELKELCPEEEEAQWYCAWLHRGLEDRGIPTLEQDHADVLSRLLIAKPHLACESPPPRSFREYVCAHRDDRVRQLLWSRVVRECTGHDASATPDQIEPPIDKWFQAGSPNRTLLEQTPCPPPAGRSEASTLLEVVGRDVIAHFQNAQNWPPILGLTRLISHALPADLEEQARRVLLDHVEAAVERLVDYYFQNLEQSLWLPEDFVDNALWLCQPMAVVAAELAPSFHRMVRLWKVLEKSLYCMTVEDVSWCFPSIFRLGTARQQEETHRDCSQVWFDLFYSAAQRQQEVPGEHALLKRYVCAGDSLFAACRCREEDALDGENLAALTKRKGEAATWFRRDLSYLQRRSWRRRGGGFNDILKDEMYGWFLPGAWKASRLDFHAVLARAQFAACVYADSDGTLGEIYSKMGMPVAAAGRSGSDPTNTAFALAGYVTLRGTQPGQPGRRAKSLEKKKRFWKALRREWKGQADLIHQTLEDCLRQLNVEPSEAAEIAGGFRQKLKTRWFPLGL